jgi:hypothetical protein
LVKKRGFSNIDEHVNNFIEEEISNSNDYGKTLMIMLIGLNGLLIWKGRIKSLSVQRTMKNFLSYYM